MMLSSQFWFFFLSLKNLNCHLQSTLQKKFQGYPLLYELVATCVFFSSNSLSFQFLNGCGLADMIVLYFNKAQIKIDQ